MASENFTQYGPSFQSKIISSLLSDNKFMQTNGYRKKSVSTLWSLEKLLHWKY